MQRQGQASRCQLLTVISMHTLPSSCCNTLHTPVARAWSSLPARCEQLVHFTSAFSKSWVLLKAMCTAEMLQHASFHWRSWSHLVQRVCVQDPAASLGAQTLRGLHGSTPNVLGHLAGPHFLAHFHQFTALNRHTILGFGIIWCWPANLGLLAALHKSILSIYGCLLNIGLIGTFYLPQLVMSTDQLSSHLANLRAPLPIRHSSFLMFSLRYILPWRTCWNYFHDGDDDLITWETRVICVSIELGLECLPVLGFQVLNYAFFSHQLWRETNSDMPHLQWENTDFTVVSKTEWAVACRVQVHVVLYNEI